MTVDDEKWAIADSPPFEIAMTTECKSTFSLENGDAKLSLVSNTSDFFDAVVVYKKDDLVKTYSNCAVELCVWKALDGDGKAMDLPANFLVDGSARTMTFDPSKTVAGLVNQKAYIACVNPGGLQWESEVKEFSVEAKCKDNLSNPST